MKSMIAVSAAACALVFGGCDQAREYLRDEPPAPPDAESVSAYYAVHRGVVGVDVSGNVVEVRVRQPYDQLERGGSLWARVGPFITLLSPSTRSVFTDFPGIAAVRVMTELPDGEEVARAMLHRDRLTDVRWRRTLNILGRALQEGQESPRRLEELTEWGEQYTDFHYNPEYVN